MATLNGLEGHQRQCDHRYVQWLWLCGILIGLIGAGATFGWAAARTLEGVRDEMVGLRDSVVVQTIENASQDVRIDRLEVRAQVLDSLAVWVPRIEQTTIETQRLVRRWGR